jgi:hypothetical protein
MLNDKRSHGLWEVTAPPPPPTAQLSQDITTDVLIVGAGFTGLSAALHLAEAGTRAVVIDAATDAIVWSDYQRHDTKQPEKVLEFCKRFDTEIEGFDAKRSRMFQQARPVGSGRSPALRYVGGDSVADGIRGIDAQDGPLAGPSRFFGKGKNRGKPFDELAFFGQWNADALKPFASGKSLGHFRPGDFFNVHRRDALGFT